MTARARRLDALVALAVVLLIAASLAVAALRAQAAEEANHGTDVHHGRDRASFEAFSQDGQNRPEPLVLPRGCAAVYEGLQPRCRSVSVARVGARRPGGVDDSRVLGAAQRGPATGRARPAIEQLSRTAERPHPT